MAEPYNLTGMLEGEGIANLMNAANSYVDNTFGIFALIVIWLVVFLRLKNYDIKVASFTASFLVTIIAMLFVMIGFVSFQIFLATILITALTAMVNKFDE